MRAKSLIALLIALIFTFSIAGMLYAAAPKEVKGTVTKIEAAKKEVTLKDAAGKMTTVKVNDVAGIKVGDVVTVKDGKATKAAKPAEAPKPKAAPGY